MSYLEARSTITAWRTIISRVALLKYHEKSVKFHQPSSHMELCVSLIAPNEHMKTLRSDSTNFDDKNIFLIDATLKSPKYIKCSQKKKKDGLLGPCKFSTE